jgi:hypothetical protein
MTEQFNYTDERFADIQMLRYRLDGFESLTLRQKLYIYYLAKATLCGRDITTDQFGRYNLRIRFLLEAVYKGYSGNRQTDEFCAVDGYSSPPSIAAQTTLAVTPTTFGLRNRGSTGEWSSNHCALPERVSVRCVATGSL